MIWNDLLGKMIRVGLFEEVTFKHYNLIKIIRHINIKARQCSRQREQQEQKTYSGNEMSCPRNSKETSVRGAALSKGH